MKRMYPLVLDIVKHFQTNNPNEICEMMGIRVRRQHLLDGRGFYIKNPWLRIIVLDDRLSLNMADIVLAHELGHIFLHHSGERLFFYDTANNPDYRRKEYEANKFAFLLIAHTCLRNSPLMIDSIRNEKKLSFEELLALLAQFEKVQCYSR